MQYSLVSLPLPSHSWPRDHCWQHASDRRQNRDDVTPILCRGDGGLVLPFPRCTQLQVRLLNQLSAQIVYCCSSCTCGSPLLIAYKLSHVGGLPCFGLQIHLPAFLSILCSFYTFTLDLDNMAKWYNLRKPCKDIFIWGFYGEKLPGLPLWKCSHFNEIAEKQR